MTKREIKKRIRNIKRLMKSAYGMELIQLESDLDSLEFLLVRAV